MSLFPPRLGTKKVVHDPKYKFQNVSTYEKTNGKTITKTEIKLPINGNKFAKHGVNKKQINDDVKDAEDERKWYENIHSISSKIKKKYEENRTTDKNASYIALTHCIASRGITLHRHHRRSQINQRRKVSST